MERIALGIAHDLSLAAWFGGAWMGAVGLNSATMEIDDHLQRARVANAGWFAWAPLLATSVGVNLASALALGRLPWTPVAGSGSVALRTSRAVTTGAAVATTALTGMLGRRIVRAGDVPVASAVRPIEATPLEVARAQRVLRVAQWLVPTLTGAVWVIDAFQRRSTRGP